MNPTVIIPSKREADGWCDLYANFEQDYIVIPPLTNRLVPTGLRSTFDKKYRIGFFERGSNTKSNSIIMAGRIDSNYTGEWFVSIYNGNDLPLLISKEVDEVLKTDLYIKIPYSKAICQFAVEEIPQVEIEEVSGGYIDGVVSDRGNGCLGSSLK